MAKPMLTHEPNTKTGVENCSLLAGLAGVPCLAGFSQEIATGYVFTTGTDRFLTNGLSIKSGVEDCITPLGIGLPSPVGPPDCGATAGLGNRSGVYVYDFRSVYSRRRGARKEGYPFAVLGLRPAAHHSQGVTSKTGKVGQNRLPRPDGSDGSCDVEMGGEGITCCEVPRICPPRRR